MTTRPMTNKQFKETLKALGLSQARAASWLGFGLRTVQSWAIGEVVVPPAVARLLRLMVWLKLQPQDVDQVAAGKVAPLADGLREQLGLTESPA